MDSFMGRGSIHGPMVACTMVTGSKTRWRATVHSPGPMGGGTLVNINKTKKRDTELFSGPISGYMRAAGTKGSSMGKVGTLWESENQGGEVSGRMGKGSNG